MPNATGQPKVERRLAAILAADVVGYSRLIGMDEEGTLAQLKSHRRELIDPKIAEYHGRMVKLTGDGALVEFPSVVEAVRCAIGIQRDMAKHKAESWEEKRLEFRVGINVGDVIIEGNDIYGDGVNVAARLEGIAEPGGICISDDVYRQVRGKLDVVFEDIGEQQLKNIAQPVRAYRVRLNGVATKVRPALSLPDKPSIAVLPFQNMSGDPEQEYFADGMVEEIITALSRIPWLFVIARNSSFRVLIMPERHFRLPGTIHTSLPTPLSRSATSVRTSLPPLRWWIDACSSTRASLSVGHAAAGSGYGLGDLISQSSISRLSFTSAHVKARLARYLALASAIFSLGDLRKRK
jgi:class 3 adenylate cyclase